MLNTTSVSTSVKNLVSVPGGRSAWPEDEPVVFFGVGALVLCMFLHRGTRIWLRNRDYSVIKSRFELESHGCTLPRVFLIRCSDGRPPNAHCEGEENGTGCHGLGRRMNAVVQQQKSVWQSALLESRGRNRQLPSNASRLELNTGED